MASALWIMHGKMVDEKETCQNETELSLSIEVYGQF